jgi:hypothetical protein
MKQQVATAQQAAAAQAAAVVGQISGPAGGIASAISKFVQNWAKVVQVLY